MELKRILAYVINPFTGVALGAALIAYNSTPQIKEDVNSAVKQQVSAMTEVVTTGYAKYTLARGATAAKKSFSERPKSPQVKKHQDHAL